MIIGFDASRANQKKKTGVEWYSYFLLQSLAKIDHENTYWLYTDRALEEGLKNLGSNFLEKKLRWPFKYLWTQGRLSLEMLLEKPDTLFIPGSIIPFIHPKRTLTAIHDVAFERYPEVYSKRERFYQNLAVFFTRFFNIKVITVSEFTKRDLVKIFNMRDENISVIPLACDSERYHPYNIEKKEEILKKYNLQRPFILYVGTLTRKKNIEKIIESFSFFSASPLGESYKLVLAGKKGKDFNIIQNTIDRSGNKEKIILPGWVSEDDLPIIMSAAHIFLFPSLYEGFGIPVLEAFSSGVPVICSDRGSLPEIAKGAALFIKPDDIENIYVAIKRLSEDTMLRESLIKAGFQRARDFSYLECAKKTLTVLLAQKEN